MSSSIVSSSPAHSLTAVTKTVDLDIPTNDEHIINDGNSRNRHSIPISSESVNANNSLVVTRVATNDTLSSSPASFIPTKIPQQQQQFQINPRLDKRSPLVHENEEVNVNNKAKDESPQQSSPSKYPNENNNVDDSNDVEIFNALGIVKLSTDKLIQMLTTLLEKIIHSNDRLASLHTENENTDELISNSNSNNDSSSSNRSSSIEDARRVSVHSFKGKHVPQINLNQYFQRIQKYCPTTNDVYLSLLIYFDRISKKCNSIPDKENNDETSGDGTTLEEDGQRSQLFVMDSFNIHRLIIAGITVSTKFLSDFFYSNSRYARVGGISLKEMNHLELQFLLLCDFNLLISIEEFERYQNLLYRFWNNSIEEPTLTE